MRNLLVRYCPKRHNPNYVAVILLLNDVVISTNCNGWLLLTKFYVTFFSDRAAFIFFGGGGSRTTFWGTYRPATTSSWLLPSLLHAYICMILPQKPPLWSYRISGLVTIAISFPLPGGGGILLWLVTNYMSLGWQPCVQLPIGSVVGCLHHVIWMVGYH